MSDENMQQQIIVITPGELAPVRSMADAGHAANAAAARGTFAEYRSRKAARTVKAQDEDLRRFARFLADAGVAVDPAQLASSPDAWAGMTWGLVRGFALWQLQQGFAVASLNRALSSVKAYAKLATQAGAIAPDEGRLIGTVTGYSSKEVRRIDGERPQSRRGVKKAESTKITKEQAQQLKTAADGSPQAHRDAFLMCILLDLGLRVGEVAGLTLDSVDLKAGLITFYREKVHETQTHKLTADTLRAAGAYLADRGNAPGALIYGSTKTGELITTGMGTRAMNKRVGALGERLGVADLSPHDARHYWATAVARAKTPLDRLRQAGGWSSLAMPSRYIHDAEIANEGVNLD